MDKNTTPKDAIVLNGMTYKVVRNNCIGGLGPDPCSLCAPTVAQKCRKDDVQPCRMFHKGHYLDKKKKI